MPTSGWPRELGECSSSGGCVTLLSSTGDTARWRTSSTPPPTASDAYILTDESLVATDPGGLDLYDVRTGGGYLIPAKAIPCFGDNCHILPPPPVDPTLTTLQSGPGNPPVRYPKQRKKCPKGKSESQRQVRQAEEEGQEEAPAPQATPQRKGGYPMRRFLSFAIAAGGDAPARCARGPGRAPTVGSVSATNIQGVSALLKGTVDPEGLATTYYFEYSTQASFAGAAKSTVTATAPGPIPSPARAAISGLKPSTLYHFGLSRPAIPGPAKPKRLHHDPGIRLPLRHQRLCGDVLRPRWRGVQPASSHPYQLDFTSV